jgi:hypothetical protein
MFYFKISKASDFKFFFLSLTLTEDVPFFKNGFDFFDEKRWGRDILSVNSLRFLLNRFLPNNKEEEANWNGGQPPIIRRRPNEKQHQEVGLDLTKIK